MTATYATAMQFVFGRYLLDAARFQLRCGEVHVPVQPKVLQLLFYLVARRDRAVTRRELLETLWSDVHVGDASLARAIVEARRAIGDDEQAMIVTVRGHGFRFAMPVTEVKEVAASPARASSVIGREACVAALVARLEHAAAGRGSSAWISGGIGIGKTHLLDELGAIGRARGAGVHTSTCHETPAPPAYWPWLQLLRSVGAEAELAALADATGAAVDLARCQRLTSVFVQAAVRPLVLVIDDVQWADAASLHVLRYFVRETRRAPILVVGAYRDAGSGDRDRMIGALLNEYGSAMIALSPLCEAETARLIATVIEREPSAQFVAAVHQRTGGCPLLVHQVLQTEWATRALARDSRTLPSSIDLRRGLLDSIGRHLDAVSPPCRDALAWASISGTELELAVVAAAASCDPLVMLDRLDEAIRGQLLVKAATGRYRFVHGLIARALYKQMSASERAQRHLAIANAIVATQPGAREHRPGDIAHHLLRAAPLGTAREAFELASCAARAAIAHNDPRAAVKHWSRAAEALDFLDDAASAAEVQRDLALARAAAGNPR